MTVEFRNRKVQRVRKTLWMSIPTEWAKHQNVKPGSIVRVMLAEDNKSLVVVADGEEHD